MIARLCLVLALLIAQPANAGCFLFFCSHSLHHVHRHHHHHRHPRIVHKIVVHETVVNKVIVRERRVPAPAVDLTPITPLK